jgi:hypothetical protein
MAQTINGIAVILIVSAIVLFSRRKKISFSQNREEADANSGTVSQD